MGIFIKHLYVFFYRMSKSVYTHTVGPKVFSQPLIVQVLLLRIMREVCNFIIGRLQL